MFQEVEKTDSLSRRLDWKVGMEKDNKNEILVKPEQLKVKRTKKIEIIVEKVDLLEKVKQSKVKDNKIIKIVEEMKQTKVKMLRDKEWKEVNGIMYKEEKIYIPKDNRLRVEIIKLYHNILVGGHREQWKIVKLIIYNFWWLGVTKVLV